MKYICAILALIVLTLSVQPVCASISSLRNCCSERDCDEDQSTDCNEKEKECSGSCNPFQICGCCAYSVVPAFQPAFVSLSEFSFIKSSWVLLNTPFIEEPVLGFWQPPKLS